MPADDLTHTAYYPPGCPTRVRPPPPTASSASPPPAAAPAAMRPKRRSGCPDSAANKNRNYRRPNRSLPRCARRGFIILRKNRSQYFQETAGQFTGRVDVGCLMHPLNPPRPLRWNQSACRLHLSPCFSRFPAYRAQCASSSIPLPPNH